MKPLRGGRFSWQRVLFIFSKKQQAPPDVGACAVDTTTGAKEE
jgi:hypothetical protein